MPNVHLYIQDGNTERLVFVVDEQIARLHLKNLLEPLSRYHPAADPKKVVLSGAPSAALVFVLHQVVKHGARTYIRLGDRLLPIAVAIHQAIEVLGVHPAQPHVEGHIVGHLSHNAVKPDDVYAIQTAYGKLGTNNRCWNALVNQLGWYFARRRYTPADFRNVNAEVQKYPELAAAVEAKRDSLVLLHEENEQQKRERLAKRDGLTQGMATMSMSVAPTSAANQQTASLTPSTIATTARDRVGYRVIEANNELQTTVRDTNTEAILNQTASFFHAQHGVVAVKVEVTIDPELISADQLPGRLGRWTKDVARMFGPGDTA